MSGMGPQANQDGAMDHKINLHKSALQLFFLVPCSSWSTESAVLGITFMRQSGEELDALETNLSSKSSSVCVAEFAEQSYHSRSRLGSTPVKFGFQVWGALKKTETSMAADFTQISRDSGGAWLILVPKFGVCKVLT